MKISVIVPVYNVELYLERCIKSILCQTYKDFELILVDDGSPDKSGEICDHYKNIDSRIRVIHKENGGLSDARNVGVLSAAGEYITFVDSDDYVSSNYLEYLLYLATKTNADISIGCFKRTNLDSCEYGKNNRYKETTVLDPIAACKEILTMGKYEPMLVIACCKLIKKDLCVRNPFPVGFKHEDRATTYKYYYCSKRIAFGNGEIYAYFQNENSIMNTRGDKKNTDMIAAKTDCALYFESKNENTLAKLAWNDLFNYLYADSAGHKGRCDTEIKNLLQQDIYCSLIYRIKLYLFAPIPMRKLKLLMLYMKEFTRLLKTSEGRATISKKLKNNKLISK